MNQTKHKIERTSHLTSVKEIDVLYKESDISKQVMDMSTTRVNVGGCEDEIEEIRLIKSNDSSNTNNDTSFSTYKDNYQKRERNIVVKWAVCLSKVIIILMLLPFIGVIGSTVLTFLGHISLFDYWYVKIVSRKFIIA